MYFDNSTVNVFKIALRLGEREESCTHHYYTCPSSVSGYILLNVPYTRDVVPRELPLFVYGWGFL